MTALKSSYKKDGVTLTKIHDGQFWDVFEADIGGVKRYEVVRPRQHYEQWEKSGFTLSNAEDAIADAISRDRATAQKALIEGGVLP